MPSTVVSPLSCPTFLWNQSMKVRCFTCGVERGEHVGGYVSTGPSDPGLTAYLSKPCDDCPSTATHNGSSAIDGRRGKFCNTHTDFDKDCHARND